MELWISYVVFYCAFFVSWRTLKITAFQALERGRRRPQGLLCRPPRPGCLHNICGPDCFVGGWWGGGLDHHHKHDPNTVTDSANGHEGCLRTALWACPARHRGHQGRIQALWCGVVWEESSDRHYKHDPHSQRSRSRSHISVSQASRLWTVFFDMRCSVWFSSCPSDTRNHWSC